MLKLLSDLRFFLVRFPCFTAYPTYNLPLRLDFSATLRVCPHRIYDGVSPHNAPFLHIKFLLLSISILRPAPLVIALSPITMAGLLSLPVELLTEIYILTGLQTGALIGIPGVNRRLREVWLRHFDRIIKNCCALSAPGHEAAIDLALVEAHSLQPFNGFHFLDASEPTPLRLYIPNICRNVHLASRFC